ncbi:MAG TPA: VOC family protein [Chitinophagaceae bacterium]|nr:VOC family protein [Chitinophagaceae bacterium]
MSAVTYSRIKKMSPQLLVSDIESSIGFYTKKLGFDVDFRYEDFYAGIIKDGYSIHLKLSRSLVQKESSRSNEDIDIIFSVDDIEGLYNEFSSKSVEFTQSMREMPYGKEFYVTDPDGHIIAFLEAP